MLSMAVPFTVTATFLPLGDQMVVGVTLVITTVGFTPSVGAGAEMVTIATFESALMSSLVVPPSSVHVPV